MNDNKSIPAILEYIVNEMCNNYCYYRFVWNEEQDGPLCDSEICENCPLNRLV